jgi:hypothetical protein
MKKLREICAAAALLIILSLPALGGHIHTDAVPPPPPPPPDSARTIGVAEPSGSSAESEIEILLTEIIVSTLQLLSVF